MSLVHPIFFAASRKPKVLRQTPTHLFKRSTKGTQLLFHSPLVTRQLFAGPRPQPSFRALSTSNPPSPKNQQPNDPNEPENREDDEWQQYRDPDQPKEFIYYNLRTAKFTKDKPKWYYPAGAGIDESPLLTYIRSDRLSANPYKKPSKWLVWLNVIVLVGSVTILAYQYIFPSPAPLNPKKVRKDEDEDEDDEDDD
eukprot:TRINITY_DN2504_c0_g1_i1.p1 TRINITY_DN2504_c0_g1~~TRINITY_DN2504_c0_g1_i1.p1  ORF type:complete len:211 (-),score=47.88 TRINITY_DN2504_c0_g1_i1:699-1286(-)